MVTEPFTTTGKAMAELQGFADCPFATAPHSIASLSEDQVTALADAVTPAVESLLLRGEAGPVAAGNGAETGSLDADATGPPSKTSCSAVRPSRDPAG